MGTSNSNSGPGGNNPLIPSWLSGDGGDGPAPPPDGPPPDGPPPVPPSPPDRPSPAPPPEPKRFQAPRTNLSRFASSGGSDRASLGRAISQYVSNASGGAGKAAQRMGASRRTGANLLGFLSDARARGAREALRALDLERLAGRPIEEIFSGLADYICPEGGSIDEGIAREAFIETIVDLSQSGITNLDALTVDQMQTVFELYATHAIEARICNDIGMKVITLPANVRDVERVQTQLRDLIRRGVSDALTTMRGTIESLTPERVLGFVDEVYESAFSILQGLGDAEAER